MEFDKNQEEALNKLKSGSILVGGVGTGKSRTALMYYFVKECKGKVSINGEGSYSPILDPKPLYIITTAAKRDKKEWNKEMIPFLIEGIVDSWNNINKYVDVKDAFFIFDEQRVVGSGSWSKSFIKIAKNNHWILLSATPGDTWSDYISVFIANGFYKNRTEFIRRHIVYSTHVDFPKIERYLEEDRLKRLRDYILVDMRSTIRKQFDNKYINVSYDKEKYKRASKDRWNIYNDSPIENASQYLQVLRKIVNTDNSRLMEVMTIFNEHPKVIIFYNYNYELDLLKSLCYESKIRFAEWNGQKHEPIPEGKSWIYLVQYNAGAEGWECIETDTIIFYSLNYSYKMMTQAAGRINRRNSPFFALHYFYLKTDSSIDTQIIQCLSQKRDFNRRDFCEKNGFAETTIPLIEENNI